MVDVPVVWAGMAAAKRATLIRNLSEPIEQDLHEGATTLESTGAGQSFARTKNVLIPRTAENFTSNASHFQPRATMAGASASSFDVKR